MKLCYLIRPLEELSAVSKLVAAISDKKIGDQRFYFPKLMLGRHLKTDDKLYPLTQTFKRYLLNDALIDPQY